MAASPKTNEVVKKDDGGIIARVMNGTVTLPEELDGIIDFKGWATSLVNRADYKEPNPDYLSTLLLMQTLTSDTMDQVFEQGDMRKLQEMIPNVPGASTGVIDIIGLYVTDSDFGEGAKTYVIISSRDCASGEEWRATTGATQVQAQLLALIALGSWPVRCKIIRTNRKDKGGRFLFWVSMPDAD